MKKEIGIIMAAGMGTRMLPLTEKTPKPLIKVHGTPMIETVIRGLRYRGIHEIYVVVGYLQEQFAYLVEKYPGVELIRNTEYSVKNNISSLYAVGNVLGLADCFICEADLYISDQTVFDCTLSRSCYFGKMVKGFSNDWIFEVDENKRIHHIGIGGTDTYNMVGISYFRAQDAKVIKMAIKDEYKNAGHENLYWDEVVERQIKNLDVYVHEVQCGQIVEIDTVEELLKMNHS